ncbi:MAG: tetracycline resistance MFS efflux pump [Myxococcaceae bacterium]
MSPPRKAGLGFIVVTLILDVLGIGLLIPILPQLVLELARGQETAAARYVGLLTASYAAMLFLFSPVIGSLSDQVGRRKVLLLSLAGSGLDYLLMAWAPTLPWFFLGRVVSGLTGASLGTAAAYIADVSPPEKRAQNFGLIGMAFGLGFVVGPALGGFLGHYSLRLPFLAAAVLILANLAWGFFVLPESLPPEHRRPFDWRRANPVGTLLALGKYPVVLGLLASAFFFALGQRGMESVWVLYTMHRYHWTVLQTSLSLTVVGLAAALVQGVLVRRLIPALGERRSFILGGTLAGLTFAAYGLATQGWMLYVILCVGALGAISAPAMQGLMSKAVAPNEQGLLQGGVSSTNSLTMTIGPLIATNVFGAFIAPAAPVYLPGAPFFVSAACVAVGLALAVRAFRGSPGAAGATATTVEGPA